MTASNLDSQWRRRAHRFGPRGRHPRPSLRQPLKAAQGLVLRGAVEAQGEGAYQVAGDAGQIYDVVDGTVPVATTNIACEVPGCGEHYWRNWDAEGKRSWLSHRAKDGSWHRYGSKK